MREFRTVIAMTSVDVLGLYQHHIIAEAFENRNVMDRECNTHARNIMASTV